jgi:predicted peptidase
VNLTTLIRLLLALAPLLSSAAARTQTGFLDRTIRVENVTYNYQVYVPRQWNKQQKWPVMLFLHGAGERGSDGILQTEVGFGTALRRYSDRFPMVVVFPQLPLHHDWLEPGTQQMALASLDAAIKDFRGDRDRIYLGGLSLGGYGTWSIAARHPRRFAALVPVCGGVLYPGAKERGTTREPYRAVARAIGNVPVWIFHGGSDPVVPADESRIMFEEVKAAGGVVRYYEYSGVEHVSWDLAFAEPELPAWLLSKRVSTIDAEQPQAEQKVIARPPN